MVWIWIQEKIFVFLVGIAIFLPIEAYSAIVGVSIVFTLVMVFTNWLLTIQIVNIIISASLGSLIIMTRDFIIKLNKYFTNIIGHREWL